MNNNYHYAMTGSMTQFLYKVYAWMAGALLLTAGTAYYVASSPYFIQKLFGTPFLLYGLFFAQLGLVVYLSAWLNRMSYSAAVASFLVYAFLNGITLSSIFLIYTFTSISMAFFISAGMFGVMALYGYYSRADLSSVGNLAGMGLIGIILASVVNIFLKSPTVDYVVSLIGVAVFTLLIAYDTQKIKQLGYTLLGQGETAAKVAILGALSLYLDFINLFLFILRLLGKRRD